MTTDSAVPIVLLFTKFDALESKAQDELEEEGLSDDDAFDQAPTRAQENFEQLKATVMASIGPESDVLCLGSMYLFYRPVHGE